jgi:hypothetical protein
MLKPQIQSPWYKRHLSWRNVFWVLGSASGVWISWLLIRSGSFLPGLSLLLLSVVLLCTGTSVLSALARFSLNPSSVAANATNPLSWASYLFVYHLFLGLFTSIFLAVPVAKYMGVSRVRLPRDFLPAGWILFTLFAVTEELTFRLPLRYSAINLTISALLFTFFPVGVVLLKFQSFGLATTTERLLGRAVFAIIVASLVLVLLRIEPVKRIVRSIWSNHLKFVVYVSCFAFGLVHLLNFQFASFTAKTLLLAPLLVFPHIIGGFILAFARMRLGMIWCILLHVAHNLFLVLFISGQVTPP